MSTKPFSRQVRDFIAGDFDGAPIVYVMGLAMVMVAMVMTVIST